MSKYRFYDKIGPIYNYMVGPRIFFTHVRKKAMGIANIKPNERVLEVGVGTGLNLMNYPPNCKVTGIDLSKSMLKEAHKFIKKKDLENIKLQEMDASYLDFEDNHFDCVLGLLFVSASKNPLQVVKEMARVCHPNGRIIIANHFLSKNFLRAGFEKSLKPFSRFFGHDSTVDIYPLIEEAGLSLDRQTGVFFNWWLVISASPK